MCRGCSHWGCAALMSQCPRWVRCCHPGEVGVVGGVTLGSVPARGAGGAEMWRCGAQPSRSELLRPSPEHPLLLF